MGSKDIYYNYAGGDGSADWQDNRIGQAAGRLGEMLLFQDARRPDRNQVAFIAFVNSFSQNFTSNWNTSEALGRMDHIATFKNTERTISVAWDIPAADAQSAHENLNRCNALIALLYPTYTEQGSANAGSYIMSKPPMVRITYSNLISIPGTGAGLLGYITSLTWTPVLEMGSFHKNGKIYPRTISISIEFTVIHESTDAKGAGPTGYYKNWVDHDNNPESAEILRNNAGLRPSKNHKGSGGAGMYGDGWPFGGVGASPRSKPDSGGATTPNETPGDKE